MDIIFLIIICLVLQLATYIYLDWKKLFGWKYVLLIVLLVLNCFVFPRFYYPPVIQGEGGQCALLFMSIYFTFILFGAGAAVLLHLIYWFIRKYV